MRGEAGVVLPTVYLAAVALPLLLTVVAIGLRISAAVGTKIDAVIEPSTAGSAPASVTALPAPRVHELASLPQVVTPLPAAPAPAGMGRPADDDDRVPRRGPLQLVDEAEPSTKHCPDCAETVLASARVCKHCHFRFEPPLRGSYAV